jgi:hypothetical protein
LHLAGISTAPQRVASDDKGRLIIAVSGNRPHSSSSPPSSWTNPQTGSKRFCLSSTATVIIALDKKSLDVLEQKDIEDTTIAALQMLDGQLYAASNHTENCKTAKHIRISTVDDRLILRTLYESKNVNNLEAFDFVATPGGFILVGSVESFAPTAVTTRNMTLEELRNYKPDPWAGDSIWEQDEEHPGAFILVVGRDGLPKSDRVFVDLRSRRLSSIVPDVDDRFVAVGNALGDRGWIINFRLGDERSMSALLHAGWQKYVIEPVMKLLPPRWR